MTNLWKARAYFLWSALLCSAAELFFAIGYFMEDRDNVITNSLDIAVSALSLIVLVFLLLVDTYRRGAQANSISFELIASGVLWVIYLLDALSMLTPSGNCELLCGVHSAMEGFAFITWAILMVYFILLLVFALVDRFRGQVEVWWTTVRDWEFFAVKDIVRNDMETGPRPEMIARARSSEQDNTRQQLPRLPRPPPSHIYTSSSRETDLPAYSDIDFDEIR